MSRAIKEVEEQLAYGKRKAMTGLQKWQLAVKYLAMHHDKAEFNYLERYQNKGELDLDLKMTAELEKTLDNTEQMRRKREQSNRREQAQSLRY